MLSSNRYLLFTRRRRHRRVVRRRRRPVCFASPLGPVKKRSVGRAPLPTGLRSRRPPAPRWAPRGRVVSRHRARCDDDGRCIVWARRRRRFIAAARRVLLCTRVGASAAHRRRHAMAAGGGDAAVRAQSSRREIRSFFAHCVRERARCGITLLLLLLLRGTGPVSAAIACVVRIPHRSRPTIYIIMYC